MWLEDLILLLFLLVILFEVILPITFGRPLFWHFRRSTWAERSADRAAEHLKNARIQLEAAQLEDEAKHIEDEAKNITTGKDK